MTSLAMNGGWTRCALWRGAARVVLIAAMFAPAAAAWAQSPGSAKGYPNKPVKVVVGYAAGGLPDTVGRLVQQMLSERWGQQVVTENRPGSGGVAAAEIVAKAPADGYTLYISDSSVISINPYLYAKLPYSDKDFTSVSIVARAALFLAVHQSIQVDSMAELIALARAKPGQLSYGSSGIGTPHHLGMEALKSALGLDVVHVPYKGSGQSVPALVGGQVAMVFSAGPSLTGYVKDGRVKIVAVNSSTRSSFAPNVPTVAESGVPGYDFALTLGYLAPAGTPQDVIQKISREIAEVVKLPDIIQRFANLGIEAAGSTPEQQAAQWRSEAERFSRAVKQVGVKAD